MPETATTTRPVESRIGLGLALSLGLLAAMGPLATDLQLPALPELASSLHTSSGLATGTVTICFAGFALGQLIVGGLSDLYGRRRPILICLALFALSGAGCALAPNIGWLLAARLIQGISGAGVQVTVRATIRDHARGSAAARLYSQISMVSMIAPIVAPLLGGALLQVTDWRGLFWAFTAISVALVVLAAVMVRESLPREARRAPGGQVKTLLRVLRHHGFGQYLVFSMCQGIILFTYISMGSLFLQHSYHISAQTYSYLFAVNGLGMVVGHFINTRVVSSWGSLNMLTAAIVGYTVGCTLLVLAVLGHAPLVFISASLFVTLATLAISMPNNMALAMLPFGAAAGAAVSLLGATQQLAGAVVPSVAAAIGTGGRAMSITMLIAAVVGVAQIFLVVRPRAHAASPEFE